MGKHGFIKGFYRPEGGGKARLARISGLAPALVKADGFDRFKALQWEIRTWDVWNFMECDPH